MATNDDSNLKQLKELNVKRSSIKGRLTKFRKYLDIICPAKLSSVQVKELKINTQKVRDMSTKFDELQSQIEVINCENLESEINERDDIEQIFTAHLALAEDILSKHNNDNNDSSSHYISHHHDCSLSCHDSEFKLPEIQIAKFDGAYFRWLAFRDTYLSLIHNNERIKPIHKFTYLSSYLEGEAARVISNLEISEANYKIAWELLCDRFDNKDQLLHHHLASLFNIASLTRATDKSLRSLVDHVTKNLRALANLGQPTEHWDTLIVYLVASKLDNHTALKWEEFRKTSKMPTLNQFKKFLIDRADVLENMYLGKLEKLKADQHHTRQSSGATHTIKPTTQTYQNAISQSIRLCVVCNQNHRIYDCPTFKSKSVQDRRAEAQRHNLCSNCLREGHNVRMCRLGPCRECKRKHNTLLHSPNLNTNEPKATIINENLSAHSSLVKQDIHPNQVLLSTAMVRITNPRTKKNLIARALLDCGSQSSFITQSLMNRLSLDSTPINSINIIGIGNNLTDKVNQSCVTQLSSLTDNNYKVIQSFYVLDQLTGTIPNRYIDIKDLKLPKGIKLADPYFNQPASIDVLIGVDLFWDLLGHNEIALGSNLPNLRASKLGWLIAGRVVPSYMEDMQQNVVHCNVAVTSNDQDSIQNQLTKFWELEEIPHKPYLCETEKLCENHFYSNTYRLKTGRFCVRLPLIDTPDCLGDSYGMAKKRLLALECRFRKNLELKSQYVNFINEYMNLGHLEKCPIKNPNPSYFLCHHAVFKQNSETTKIRVVFDGSASTNSGFSLNDLQLVGPNVQSSLFSILIRARQYKYLLTGDIEKMYRQIELDERDRNLQLILWREDEAKPIETFRLKTVTYGLASAAYLSTKCLSTLGEHCSDPLISTIIKNDFYVDDLITGSDNETELLHIQHTVSSTLAAGCFNLRKYKSNLFSILNSVRDDKDHNVIISESSNTLGLSWNPKSDTLHIPISSSNHSQEITKRLILSTSFKIFDPLGLLSPCIILPKILLQSLWLSKADWDEPVNSSIQTSWNRFINNLECLSSLHIPRRVLCTSPDIIEIHTFSDASQVALGACIYMRSVNSLGELEVKLLCAKSKVCPLKPTTIPRLELCAALLAAKLCKSVISSLRYKVNTVVHWCDSCVVLSWLQGNTRKLKTFVSNRVVEICEITNSTSWRYVPTDQNPADLISRGVDPDQISSKDLWWSGPNFLIKAESDWPKLHDLIDESDIPEIKSNSAVGMESNNFFNKFSSFNKLRRSFAYVLRFIHNTRYSTNKITGRLTLDEMNTAFITLCRIAQQESFAHEYDILIKNKSLSNKSSILSLAPFLDNDKLIRVGGRIDLSNYDYSKRHPILMHASHHLSKLYFKHLHYCNMHAGPQLLLACVRETIWPINGRHLARRTVHSCLTCRRLQGKLMTPMMGSLPIQRITPDFPFRTVGVDFAGPFYTINKRGRGARVTKTYLCLFVCFRYKCMHLEAVSDLSKDAFILTLRRFIARRGKPTEIFCDNGRNFVAASKEIGFFLKNTQEPDSDFAENEGIKFVFSPAYTPHFGGLWEAGVKSAKYHIKRVMGNTHLTFEEISTLFAQVEAILNSRPLCPLSSSPNDFHFLSPGHFLIGRPLNALPDPSLNNYKCNNLQRYLRLQQIQLHFWQRWQREYIGELQQRSKWRKNADTLRVGDLVLLHEDNVPPLCWRMGRVSRLFPGPDGISRVVDILTTRGSFRRPVTRICPLLAPDDNDC
ncbi:uncharacterized protein LOC115442195 [Manduca sexta]|uniref:uncharacterized protein LOC115442195 n=1 Tax=Manduca sexta TaxID=7130 RepID=UPI00189027F3|nr:uncharacterized protein LOC115442195 [Manduca sexta]